MLVRNLLLTGTIGGSGVTDRGTWTGLATLFREVTPGMDWAFLGSSIKSSSSESDESDRILFMLGSNSVKL